MAGGLYPLELVNCYMTSPPPQTSVILQLLLNQPIINQMLHTDIHLRE